jgi:hypothetical protein
MFRNLDPPLLHPRGIIAICNLRAVKNNSQSWRSSPQGPQKRDRGSICGGRSKELPTSGKNAEKAPVVPLCSSAREDSCVVQKRKRRRVEQKGKVGVEVENKEGGLAMQWKWKEEKAGRKAGSIAVK